MRGMVITAVLGLVSAVLYAREPAGLRPVEEVAQNPSASATPLQWKGDAPRVGLGAGAGQQFPAQATIGQPQAQNPPPPPEVRNPPNIYMGNRPTTNPPIPGVNPGVIPNQPPMKN